MNFPGFLGASSTLFSHKADVERTVNLYRETIESGEGVNRYALYRMPGLQNFLSTAVTARIRGMLELNETLFVVERSSILQISSDGSSAGGSLGPIQDDGRAVSMAVSPTSLMIVSGGILYRVNAGALSAPATTFTPIAVVSISSYFVALSDDNQFYFSSDDGATWSASDVQTAEASANDLLAIIVHHETLFIYGTRVTQAFLVGPNPDAPFVPQSNAVIPMGIQGQFTLQALGQFRYWLGRNKDGQYVVYRSSGYDFTRISTHAVENKIREYADEFGIDDAEAWVHQTNGHECYRITFPTAKATWEYDATEDFWAEALFFNEDTGEYEAHRGICAVSAFGKTLVGDREIQRIYEMTPDVYSDNGVTAGQWNGRIRWLRRAPHLIEENKLVRYDRFELGMQTGVGNGFSAEDNPEGDPQVTLRYSNDGGQTWSNEMNRSMGQLGKYGHRPYWTRLGSGRDRVFEVSGTAAVFTAITAAWIEFEELMN